MNTKKAPYSFPQSSMMSQNACFDRTTLENPKIFFNNQPQWNKEL